MGYVVDIFFYKETRHTKLSQMITFLFVISLGFGEVVNIAGIKLSYLMFVLMFLCSVYETKGKIIFFSYKKKIFIFFVFCFLWMCYPVVQFFWVKDIALWISFYRSLIINLLVIMLLMVYINTWEDWKWVSKAFIVLQVIILAVGYWEINTGHHLVMLLGDINAITYAAKPLSFYGNGNDNATILFYCLCNILIYLFAEKRKPVNNFIFIVIIAATIDQIRIINARAETYSVFLLVLFSIYFLSVIYVGKSNYINGIRYEIITMGIGIVLLVCVFLIHPLEYYFELYSGAGNYESDIGRIEIIINIFDAFIKTLFMGLGSGQSIIINGINVHFFYLEILFEYGIFVGGYVLLRIILLAFNKHPGLSPLSESIVRAFPFVMILAGVSSSKVFILRPTWVMLALMFTLEYVKSKEIEEKVHTNYTLVR